MLKAGDIINRGPQLGLWYVECVTHSGAHCIGLSGFEAPITAKRPVKVTKIVQRHKRMQVIAANSMVEIVDPSRLDMVAIRKRIRMARKQEVQPQAGEGVTSTEAQAERPAATPRATQSYVATDKETKGEMRGQGKIVMDAIKAAGGPVNVTSLSQTIGKFEGSRQDTERVVVFYLSKFKREGLVKVVEAPASAPAEAAAAEV